MRKIKDMANSFKVIKKWDWWYAIEYIGCIVAWIGFEAWFCWMIASHL